MPIDKVILHVGLMKTGTTSMQASLSHPLNQKILEKNGLVYPTQWGEHNSVAHLFALFAEKYVAPVKSGEYLRPNAVEAYKENLAQQLLDNIARLPGHTLLLSSELMSFFVHSSVENIRGFIRTHFGQVPIKVLIYLRNPIDYMTSLIQQTVTYPVYNYRTIAEISQDVLSSAGLWKKVVENYRNAFGMDSVEVYEFEKCVDYPQAGIVGHFLSTIGFSDADISQCYIARSNAARSFEAMELMDYINAKSPLTFCEGDIYKNNPERFICAHDLAPIREVQGTRFYLTAKEQQRILDITKSDMAWLKNNTGIDYTQREIVHTQVPALYSEATLADFGRVFRRIHKNTQPYFMRFFRDKYRTTGDERFKALFAKGSSVFTTFQFGTRLARLVKQKEDTSFAKWMEEKFYETVATIVLQTDDGTTSTILHYEQAKKKYYSVPISSC